MKPDKFIITMSDRLQAKREWNLILRQTLTEIYLNIRIGQIDYSDGWTTSKFWASLQVRIITFRYRESPFFWSREWSIEDWEDIIICFKHRLRHRMRLIQGAKTEVAFWLWRSRTQPRKTLRSGRGLKTLDRSTFSSIIEPWKDEGRVLTMVGLIKEKIRPLIDRYFSWIVSIPLYQGLEFSPTWKAQTTFRLTKSLLVNWPMEACEVY